ncbi:paired domain-containing protein [Trichonephila clavipes]|nr:paired domain-containing protein [Trichonephila clavipes]
MEHLDKQRLLKAKYSCLQKTKEVRKEKKDSRGREDDEIQKTVDHLKFVDNMQWGITMSEKRHLPDSLKCRVVGCIEMVLYHADTARRLNVSRSVVPRLWNQYQTEAYVSRRNVPGQPRATTPAGDHLSLFRPEGKGFMCRNLLQTTL